MRRIKAEIKRIAAAMLSLTMTLSCPGIAVPSYAGEAEAVVYISSAKELSELTDSCRQQNYSKGRAFVLTADIDLSEYENLCIPYMDGVFDAKGHTITGLTINDNMSDGGLFRFVGPEGSICNLTLEGTLISDDEQQHLGLIVGNNEGVISKCTAKGNITANGQVGGIAGVNESSGSIRDCLNEAAVNGKYQTGGIAGLNRGSIIDSNNQGKINTDRRLTKNARNSTGDSVNISIPNAVTGFAADERANETGGIAGKNEGSIAFCDNTASIGSLQLGSSSGGVAGRNSGRIEGCTNSGAVLGHRNVGGIAGYLDPYRARSLDEDHYGELQDALNAASDSLEQLSIAGEDLGDNLIGNLGAINHKLEDLRDSLRGYMDSFEGDIRSSQSIMDESADGLLDSLEDMDLRLRLNRLGELEQQLYNDLEEAGVLVNRLRRNCEKEASGVSAAISELADKYEALIEQLKKHKSELDRVIAKIKEKENGKVSENSIDEEYEESAAEEYEEAYEAEESELYDEEGEGVSDNRSFARADTRAGITDETKETVEQIEAKLKDAKGQITEMVSILEKWPKEAKKVRRELKKSLDSMEAIKDEAASLADSLEQRSDALKAEVRPQTDDIFDSVDTTINTAQSDFDRVAAHMEKLRSSFELVRTAAANTRSDLHSVREEKSVYVDVSKELGSTNADGKIYACSNSGIIQAESLAGGIAGSISIEKGRDVAFELFEKFTDRDDDDETTGEDKDSILYHVSAAILQCLNEGSVEVKKDYAGGIVGNAKYGIIRSCQSYCDVSSAEGQYIGGIAGSSALEISSCYTMGGISGIAYLGGIAGKGCDISGCYGNTYMDIDTISRKAVGAVAGQAKGSVENNIFVDEGYGGVDGVTLIGQSSSCSYRELMAMGNMPPQFGRCLVRFVDGDRIIFEKQFNYGDSFNEDMYPALDTREGEYASWESKEISPVKRNVTVHSIRSGYVPSVASEGEEGPAALVLEGRFYPETRLVVAEADGNQSNSIKAAKEKLNSDIHYVIVKSYRYDILQDMPFEGRAKLRIRKGMLPCNSVLILDDGFEPVTEIEEVDSIDSYLCDEADMTSSGYVVLIEHVSRITVAAVVFLVMAVVLLAVVFRLFIKRRKKKTIKAQEG